MIEPFHNFRELRALAEELTATESGEHHQALNTALSQWLRLHCRNCGELLEREQRAANDEFCYACVDETPRQPSRDVQ